MVRFISIFLFTLVASAGYATSVSAQEPKLLQSYNEYWQAYEGSNGGQKYCFAATIPTDSKTNPKNFKRDDTYFFITREPSSNVYNELNIILGYEADARSFVIVQIGSDKYDFVTKGDAAWAKQPNLENDIVNNIKRGLDMIVTGTAADGTVIVDNYTLKGATATINHITRECP